MIKDFRPCLWALLVVMRRERLEHPADLLGLPRQPERLQVCAQGTVEGHPREVELLGEALQDADVERVRLAKVLAQQILQADGQRTASASGEVHLAD